MWGNFIVTHYVKTERHFKVRPSEHLKISHLAGRRVEWKPSSVSDHFLLHKHDNNLSSGFLIGPRKKFISRDHLWPLIFLKKSREIS